MITTFNLFSLIGELTTEQTIAIIRGLLNEQDNQRIQDLAIRVFINSAKQEIHEKLMSINTPHYDYIFHATSERIVYQSVDDTIDDVDYEAMNNAYFVNQLNNRFNIREIDLGNPVDINRVHLTPVGTVSGFYGRSSIRPIEYLYSIKSVSLLGHGTGKQVGYQELMDISHTDTKLWQYSFLWTFVGTKILIVPGRKMMDVIDLDDYYDHFVNEIYEIHSVRKPLLDDLALQGASVTFPRSVDLPNTQYSSLFTSVQKACLESLQKLSLPQLDQSVDAAIQNKVQTVMTNKQIGAI